MKLPDSPVTFANTTMMTPVTTIRVRGSCGLVLAVLFAALAAPRQTAAQQILPTPENHVEDRAHVIDRGVWTKLDAFLTELEQKTRFQMIVLTVNSTGGEPVEEFALRHAEAWKLGQKETDSGVLVVIAVKDRRYRIETGYGAEGVLPDAFCGAVARQYFVPNFRRGDYSKGIYEGTLALANKVAKDEGITVSGMPARTVRSTARHPGGHPGAGTRPHAFIPCISSLFPLIVILTIISALTRRRRGYGRWGGGFSPWWLLLLLGTGRSRSWGGGFGGGFGGGGFGGGGFGSFGGGGGGSFGGGGASGGW